MEGSRLIAFGKIHKGTAEHCRLVVIGQDQKNIRLSGHAACVSYHGNWEKVKGFFSPRPAA